MPFSGDLTDQYVSERLRTSSGGELWTYLLRHENPLTCKCYSSAKSTATVAATSAAGSTHTPDGASGFGTLVGTAKTRHGAKRLARKNAKASDLGTP